MSYLKNRFKIHHDRDLLPLRVVEERRDLRAARGVRRVLVHGRPEGPGEGQPPEVGTNTLDQDLYLRSYGHALKL